MPNEPTLKKVKAYVRRLLEAANRYSPTDGEPALLHVRYRDHLRFFGWDLFHAVERMEAGAYLDRLGWKVWEDPEWLLLWQGGPNMEARAILKKCILEAIRLDTPELIQDLRWVFAGLLLLCSPKFDCLLLSQPAEED